MEAFIPLADFLHNQHLIKFNPLACWPNSNQSAINIHKTLFCALLYMIQYKQLNYTSSAKKLPTFLSPWTSVKMIVGIRGKTVIPQAEWFC